MIETLASIYLGIGTVVAILLLIFLHSDFFDQESNRLYGNSLNPAIKIMFPVGMILLWPSFIWTYIKFKRKHNG